MTDPALIERITRSLAFMLRHQPEKFDLELDSHGFAELDDVVRALNERLGEPVEDEDVQEAVRSGDRPRYEIQGTRVRALYGHSIPVEPGPSSKPPEVLYVAVPEQEVERARRFGLRGGRRRFLHLGNTREDALESGRRAARDYTVLLIRALDAWEEGISFYDRRSLWLAEEIPTHLIEVEGTYHDGTDPLPRHSEPPRERWQRDREPRRPREGRERWERQESRSNAGGESPAFAPGGARESEDRRGEGRRRGRRGRRGREPERDPGSRERPPERDRTSRERSHRPPREAAPPAASPERSAATSPPAISPPRPPARSHAPSSEPTRPFGAGLEGEEAAKEARKEVRREPAAQVPQPAPPAPEKPRDSGGLSSFGAGL